MARRSPLSRLLRGVLVPALVGLGAVAADPPAPLEPAADPPPPPPAEFTAALAQVAELEAQAQFAKALREAKALQATTKDPALLGQLRSLVTRLREEDETAVGLDFAIEQLIGADSHSRKTARKKLKDAGETGRILLRQAMRDGKGQLADEAALALLEMGDAKARDYLLKRIHDAPTAPASQRLLRALRPSLAQLAPEQFVKVYAHLQQAGTEARFKVRDSVGFLADVYRVVCGEDEARLNQCLGDPKAFATLVAYVEAATDSTDPELKAWADSEGAAFRPGPRPVAWWRLDETAGTTATDRADKGNTGKLVNGPTWTTGIVGGALAFDGTDDYVEVANSATLAIGKNNADFSVTLWLRLEQGATGQWRNFVHKGTGDNQRTFAMWLHPDKNQIHFRISTTKDQNEGGDSTAEVVVGAWTQVAYVKAGKTLALYLNGVLDASVPLAGDVVINDGPLYLGKDPWYAGPKARLDDVRLYDRALSAADIAAEVSRVTRRASPPPKAP